MNFPIYSYQTYHDIFQHEKSMISIICHPIIISYHKHMGTLHFSWANSTVQGIAQQFNQLGRIDILAYELDAIIQKNYFDRLITLNLINAIQSELVKYILKMCTECPAFDHFYKASII